MKPRGLDKKRKNALMKLRTAHGTKAVMTLIPRFSKIDTINQSSKNVLGNLKLTKCHEFKSRVSFCVSKANIYDQCNLSDSEISIGSRKKERMKRLESLEMEIEREMNLPTLESSLHKKELKMSSPRVEESSLQTCMNHGHVPRVHSDTPKDNKS